MNRVFTIFLLSLLTVSLTNCASQLERIRKQNTPEGQGGKRVVDLSRLYFSQIVDGSEVTVEEHMETYELNHMVLMFGSRGCSKCLDKSKELRDLYIPSHDLFLKTPDFQLMGISTDPKESRAQVLRYTLKNRFDFMKWQDPHGEVLLRELVPKGESLGVPFTVLLKKDGTVLWHINNKKKVDVATVIAKISTSITGKKIAVKKPKKKLVVDDEPLVTNPVEPIDSANNLLKPGVDRLNGQMVKDCQGKTFDMGDLLKNHSHIETGVPVIKWVQLLDGKCDESCLSNHNQIVGHGGLTIVSEPLDFCTEGLYQGGADLTAAFSPLFDWQHEVVEEGYSVVLKQSTAPMLIAFGNEGNIYHTLEGALLEGDIIAAESTLSADSIARSVDFTMYHFGEEISFSDMRRTTEYTVLFAFDQYCTSCQKELAHWSKKDGLLDICIDKPESCQIIALETSHPGEDEDLEAYRVGLEDGPLKEAGNRISVTIDPQGYGEDGMGYLKRIYDGYLTAKFPEWEGYGAVIYTKEGIIVGSYKSEDPSEHDDLVTERIKELLGE
jgi:hypothetical protein